MNLENYKEAIANAEAAISNEKFDVALEWFKKALEENPDGVQALSGAGMVCVPMARFEESITYFQKATEVEPENGDNYFNLGNTYFFSGNISKALDLYSEAQMHELSDGARSRLYYHMALICSEKQDADAALINLKKCEDSDKVGDIVSDEDFISEKIKLLMMSEDFDNAEKYAAQFVSVAPGELRSYMVYFSILMATGKYDKAEKVLDDAEKYAKLDNDNTVSLKMEKAALLMAKAEANPDEADKYLSDAYNMLIELKKSSPKSRQNEISLVISEICMRVGRLDEAIETANEVLTGRENIKQSAPVHRETDVELDSDEVESMLDRDIMEVDEKISTGELEEDLGYTAEIDYDENGNEIRIYPEGTFDALVDNSDENDEAEEADEEEDIEAEAPSADFYDRLYFVLMTCYSEKEDYKNTFKFAGLLKQSGNSYYSYLGRYTEAYSMKKLAESSNEFSKEEAEKTYTETIAFYRTKMIENPGNNIAAVFRARMYAEIGKFAKAEEMANLLSAEDTETIMKYINECRKEQNMNT